MLRMCPLSTGLEYSSSLSPPLSASLSVGITALKKKIYSVIKYRTITLKGRNSHRAERWVLQTPTETIWSLHSKWHLQLWACLLPFLRFCLVQRNTVFEHRHPDNSIKSQGKLSLCFPLPWEFQPLKSLFLFLNKFLYTLLMLSNWLSKILSEWWTTLALSSVKDEQLLGSRRGCYSSSCRGRHTKSQDLFLSPRSLWSWDQPMIACGPNLTCHLFLCGLQGRMVFIFSRGRKIFRTRRLPQ